MPPKPKSPPKPAKGKTVATLRHDAKRKNLPTVEYQSLMQDADKSPIQVAYPHWNDRYVLRADDAKAASVVHCYGINTCKGTSDCKTAKNECKGMNSCKGMGWNAKASAKECTAAGGKVVK